MARPLTHCIHTLDLLSSCKDCVIMASAYASYGITIATPNTQTKHPSV